MRVLLLAQVFPPAKGGSGRWLWELYRRLSGLDVHVVAGLADDSASFDKTAELAIERMPLSFSSWGIGNARGAAQYLRALAHLRRVIKEKAPDAIHCGKCLPEGLLAFAMNKWHGRPFLVYVHGEELTLASDSRELRWLTRKVLRAATSIVANSEHTKKLLLEHWGVAAANVAVMHPGVDTSRFIPVARDPAVRSRLGWDNRRVVLTVGALQKRKGQDMLIRALPAIRARCPDVLYSIVGEGWERPYLDDLVSSCGVADAVQFRSIHSDDELIECYQQCDLFALPNRQVGWDFEGFGIVLLEAQACGIPVIAGQSGGTAETMQPSRTGEVVSCETPEPLADAVVALLQDPARRVVMGRCGRQWAVEQFDWTVLTRRALSTFVQS